MGLERDDSSRYPGVRELLEARLRSLPNALERRHRSVLTFLQLLRQVQQQHLSSVTSLEQVHERNNGRFVGQRPAIKISDARNGRRQVSVKERDSTSGPLVALNFILDVRQRRDSCSKELRCRDARASRALARLDRVFEALIFRVLVVEPLRDKQSRQRQDRAHRLHPACKPCVIVGKPDHGRQGEQPHDQDCRGRPSSASHSRSKVTLHPAHAATAEAA